MPDLLPRLYVIADIETLERHSVALEDFAQSLASAGVGLVQLRDKKSSPAQILHHAAILLAALPGATLLMNDRADLALLAAFSGVHLGQTDLDPADARTVLPTGLLGLSTHTESQLLAADRSPAGYLAIGPVFATSTKPDAAPVVGLEGVRRARALTARPLVAIGGITRQNCRSVLDAGADSVAVISALFSPGETVEQVVQDFLRILR